MIAPVYLDVLRQIHARLRGCRIPWAITGSLGLALQGMPVEIHDIDLQTDRAGAYEIERHLAEFVVRQICFSRAETIRSHFGALQIDGIQVEIMGNIQKRLDGGGWEEPVDLVPITRMVDIEGMQVPVLSLEYECEAYAKLGRADRADEIRRWLVNHPVE